MAGLCFCFFIYFFPSPPIRSGEVFSSVIFFLSFSSFVCFLGCSDGMEREACVCDHGFERSDLCAEIIIIIITQRPRFPWLAGRRPKNAKRVK